MRIILLILLTGCTSNQAYLDEHRLALFNFNYEADKENEYRVYDSISEPFGGDCEDYAFTLQKQIGGDVWHVLIDAGSHAVLVKDGVVYDSLSKWPIDQESYRGIFIKEINMDIRQDI